MHPDFKIQEIFPERFAIPLKQTSAYHEFVYNTVDSRYLDLAYLEYPLISK